MTAPYATLTTYEMTPCLAQQGRIMCVMIMTRRRRQLLGFALLCLSPGINHRIAPSIAFFAVPFPRIDASRRVVSIDRHGWPCPIDNDSDKVFYDVN